MANGAVIIDLSAMAAAVDENGRGCVFQGGENWIEPVSGPLVHFDPEVH
jgi:hypothetical protein